MLRFLPLCLFAAGLTGQDPKFAYPAPPASEVLVRKDIAFAAPAGKSLLMDVYQPAKPGSTSRLPAIILLSAGGSQRDMDFYIAWAKAATAHGFVAINPDGDQEHFEENFDALLTYLTEHAADLHIDASAIAVYAGSGNVYR